MFTEGKHVLFRDMGVIFLVSTLCVVFQPGSAVAAHKAAAPRTWSAVVGIENQDRAIQGMAFLPNALWVNVGDSIVWNAKSGEIHTVTFLPPGQQLPPFNETDPQQIKKVGSNTYDGKHYFNSGVMSNASNSGFQASKTYSLSFGVPGDFIYYCIVHPSMIGVVHVRPAGTPYPFSQQAYDQQVQAGIQGMTSDGQNLVGMAKTMTNGHQVVAGLGDGLVGLMRFYPASIKIHVGETVTFTNYDVMDPHTVTFGKEQKDILHPYGDSKRFDGSSSLNSGFIGIVPAWSGKSFSVTFTKAGTFRYLCVLHAYIGMIGEVVVVK